MKIGENIKIISMARVKRSILFLNNYTYYLGLVVTKPVFQVSDKVRLKPVSLATETCKKIEILLVANSDIILSN